VTRAPSFRLSVRPALLGAALAGLGAGLAAQAAGRTDLAAAAWAAGTVPVLGGLLWQIAASLRRGEAGLDIVAALSMTAALVFDERLAAAVVALMYAGGQHLERYAEGRARREMTALLARAPRVALRHRGGSLEEVALDAVAPGDRLLIRRGDVVPVDGAVASGVALLDRSTLTGEPLPVRLGPGEAAESGSANVGDAFDLIADRRAADSAFAAILRLVEAAQAERAPMARLADRWALGFLALTVALAGGAWAATGDPTRAVAVLVVATPCPLILAVPVAMVAGLSRAAARGILVKSGRALEALARVRVLVLDKTGTLTRGEAEVAAVRPLGALPADEALRLAASLDRASRHPVAAALARHAAARGLALTAPVAVAETPGEGVAGAVDGRRVLVGGRGWVAAQVGAPPPPSGTDDGAAVAAVAVDGAWAAEIALADAPRPEAAAFARGLRAAGVARLVLATGDRRAAAEAAAGGLGLDAVHADLSPAGKVAVVRAERAHGPVMMLGDGVNDAPALAAADVGVAMGAKGAAASAETADVVLLVDDLGRALPAVLIARRSRAIALQSVAVGIGLSAAGMVAAALGWLTPVQGALLQEAIDVAAILNALRALGGAEERA
jgi:heavy metal translocating P-type ATPase